MDDIKAFNFTYDYAPVSTDDIGAATFGLFEHGAVYPSSAVALVAHSTFKNASCEQPAMDINTHTIGEHIYQYQERGSTLASYNCTWVDGGYNWVEVYLNQAPHTPPLFDLIFDRALCTLAACLRRACKAQQHGRSDEAAGVCHIEFACNVWS